MRVLHFYTALFVPTRGGLERSVLRIALALSDAETKVIVYVRLADHDYSTTPAIEGVEVVSLAALRNIWAEPLTNSDVPGSRMAAEEARLNFLLLRAQIERRMHRERQSRHALVSFFLSHEGFTAQAVAASLGIPHIATVRGTDFGRGFYAPSEFPIVTSVAAAADLVVTTNRTQAAELQRVVPGCRTETIHNSVAGNLLTCSWRSTHHGTVRLVSDGGYSHRKGTQVLLSAFATLRAERLPVTLAIIGDAERKQHAYWSALRDSYVAQLGTVLMLGDYVDATDVPAFLLGGDIYCLASLAEGCSQARCGALAVGMPMVSTRCGEIPDLAEDVSHVRLAAPADQEGFTDALRQACRDVLTGSIAVDASRVEEWRCHFAPERERTAWLAAVRRVLP